MSKHPDCEANGCQLREHKGYTTCERSGQCHMDADTAPRARFDDELKRVIELSAGRKRYSSIQLVDLLGRSALEILVLARTARIVAEHTHDKPGADQLFEALAALDAKVKP